MTNLEKIKLAIKASITVDMLVSLLNIDVKHDSSSEIRACCPVHGGDNKTAFRLKKDTKTWTCFSKQCHELFGRDVFGLVMGVLNVDFMNAVKLLAEACGITKGSVSSKELLKIKLDADFNYIKSRVNTTYMPPQDVNENTLKQHIDLRTDYFMRPENGGFLESTLDYFEIGGHYYDVFNIQRELIPIRDDIGNLIAFCGRRVDGKKQFKYLFTNGFRKQSCLYNLFNAKKYIGENKTVVIVEGFKSVWFLYELGILNAVACMGSSLVNSQINLLCKYCFNVVLLLDNDEAGKLGSERSIELLRNKIGYSKINLDKKYGLIGDMTSPCDYDCGYILKKLNEKGVEQWQKKK